MSTKFYVVCPDWRSGPIRDRAQAERRLRDIERAGHCKLEHRIEERT